MAYFHSHDLFILSITSPPESPLSPGLLLLLSITLWSDNRALPFCSLKLELVFKSTAGLEEEYTLFDTFFLISSVSGFNVLTSRTTSLTSLHFLPSSFISAPCFISDRFFQYSHGILTSTSL